MLFRPRYYTLWPWRVEKRNAPVSGCSSGGAALYKFWRTDATFARGIYEIINGCAGTLRLRQRNKRFRERQIRRNQNRGYRFRSGCQRNQRAEYQPVRLPDWSRQQIAVTLNGVFTFQHGNHDRARVMNSTRPSKNGFPSCSA